MQNETAVRLVLQRMHHRAGGSCPLIEVQARNDAVLQAAPLALTGKSQKVVLQGRRLHRIVLDLHALQRVVDERVEWQHTQDRSSRTQDPDLSQADDRLPARCGWVIAVHEQKLVAVTHIVQDLQQVAAEQRVDSFEHA